MSSKKSKFQIDDSVPLIANHTGRWYKAKILKTLLCGNSWKYFVHYDGWISKYDTWVDESKIREMSNLKIEKLGSILPELLTTTQPTIVKKRGRTAKIKEVAVNKNVALVDVKVNDKEEEIVNVVDEQGSAKKRRIGGGRMTLIEPEETSKKRIRALLNMDIEDELEVFNSKIQLPSPLNRFLVEEHEYIATEPKKLLKLPRQVTISSILNSFLDWKKQKIDEDQMKVYIDIMSGLKAYINKILPVLLLFRHERDQYDLVEETIKLAPVDIFGIEHILRLFAKMPKFLSTVTVKQAEINQFESKMLELIKYVQKNMAHLFCPADYLLADDAMEFIRNYKNIGNVV